MTHDLRTVQRVADRIVMLYPRSKLADEDSQVVFDGTLDELASSDDPRIREYIGDELHVSSQHQVKRPQLENTGRIAG